MAPNTSAGIVLTKQASTDNKLNPVTHHFEFSGPYLGPVGIIIGLPILTWAYATLCNTAGWPANPLNGAAGFQAFTGFTLQNGIDALKNTWSAEVFAIYLCWWLGLAVMYLVVPGVTATGIKLRDGSQLTYELNGLTSLIVVLIGSAGWQYVKPFGVSVSWLYDEHAKIITSAIVFSFLLSFFLYAYSFQTTSKGECKLLAEGGNSGITVYDFFIGRELNPRIFNRRLDLKYFCELRPGLFLWFLFNIAAAVKQYEKTGTLDASMIIVLLFEGYYVLDSVMNEAAILTTMDITTDGFGFMLVFGDLAWVPGVYSLQARFLAERAGAGTLFNTLAVLIGLTGMYIFRASNSQKDAWKRDPTDQQFKNVKSVLTSTGTRLLAEGSWWGVARHINYFADWIMSVAWCLPTGFASPLTYFYPVYFAILLIHRDMRDGEKCAAKYGKAWEEYCSRVKSRIVPYVY